MITINITTKNAPYRPKPTSLVGITNSSDYSPFGVQLDGRTVSRDSYRYGYQGSEKDDEAKGSGNSYTTLYRQQDPRVGRWFSVDPVKKSDFSLYSLMSNNPIIFIDPNGDDYYYNEKGEYLFADKKTSNDPKSKILVDQNFQIN